MIKNKKPEFEIGQLVIAKSSYQHLLTEGRQYMVLAYEPELYAGVYTWPANITVLGDNGKNVTGNVHRFRAVGPSN